MEKNIVLILGVLVGVFQAHPTTPVQPENLEVGLRYCVLPRGIFTGTQPSYQQMITGIEVIDDYESLILSSVTPDGEVKRTEANFRTEDSRVYQWVEGEWYLIYDFALQPGAEMEGYYTIPKLGKVTYRCVSVQENPLYNNLKTIRLQVKYPQDHDFGGDEEWIIGIGSTAELLIPTMDHMVGSGGPFLEWVSLDGEEFFNLYTLSVEGLDADGNSLKNKVLYDMNGGRINASPDTLTPGIYIQRDGETIRKILVK